MLRALSQVTCGFAVDQLTHALQTATRAERAGVDADVIVASLCHDIAKAISEPNHPAVAAALLTPYVRDEVVWMIQVHQDFQGRHYYAFLGKDPDARRQHTGHPAYELAERFADEWDQTSFDPDYDTLPLEHFEPLVREKLRCSPTHLNLTPPRLPSRSPNEPSGHANEGALQGRDHGSGSGTGPGAQAAIYDMSHILVRHEA